MIKAHLLHLSYNMWGDTPAPPHASPKERTLHYDPRLRCDRALWRECVQRMAAAGLNMAVVDLGDGVRYRSRPEIAAQGAWTVPELRDELRFCRDLGVEPVPKLNFSASHDAWMGLFSRRVSTPEYYALCHDLIREAAELFDGPRFFHLGMDEETFPNPNRSGLAYVVIRRQDLWWHDLNALAEEARTAGCRPWVWSDVLWHSSPEEFGRNMPHDVVQSNWYYDAQFPPQGTAAGVRADAPPEPDSASPFWASEAPCALRAFSALAFMGYDQIPTGSTCDCRDNYAALVSYCRGTIPAESLLGFMMTDWLPLTPEWRQDHLAAIELAGRSNPE